MEKNRPLSVGPEQELGTGVVGGGEYSLHWRGLCPGLWGENKEMTIY